MAGTGLGKPSRATCLEAGCLKSPKIRGLRATSPEATELLYLLLEAFRAGEKKSITIGKPQRPAWCWPCLPGVFGFLVCPGNSSFLPSVYLVVFVCLFLKAKLNGKISSDILIRAGSCCFALQIFDSKRLEKWLSLNLVCPICILQQW